MRHWRHTSRSSDPRSIRLRSALAVSLSLLSLPPAPVHASTIESRFTSIANRDCVIAPPIDEEIEEQSKTCLGVTGISVVVSGLGASVQIALAWDGTTVDEAPAVVEAWSAGEKMEWRGPVEAGVFNPQAAVVRMLFPRDGTPDIGHQVLAIIRVEDGQACLLGAVDIGANEDGYQLARSWSDKAADFECGRDSPLAIGRETEWTRRIIDTARE